MGWFGGKGVELHPWGPKIKFHKWLPRLGGDMCQWLAKWEIIKLKLYI